MNIIMLIQIAILCNFVMDIMLIIMMRKIVNTLKQKTPRTK